MTPQIIKSATCRHAKLGQAGSSRRRFLHGLGASLALPWLETFNAPAWGQASAPPKRFIAFFTPNGFNMSRFWPSQPGPLSAESLAPTSLSPLSDFASRLLIVNGLDNHAGTSQGDGPGDHARGTSTTLTCTHPLKSANELRLGVSVDQLLADQWGLETQLRSLELGCDGGGNAGSCDSGYSCAYSRNISWADEQTPLPKETNPRLLFNRLFGALDPNQSPEAIAHRLSQRRSVLDFVTADAQRLLTEVSARDRQRIEAYLTGIREVERRLESSEEAQCSPELAMPEGIPSDRGEHARLLLDLSVSALRCDLTRVSTFMLSNGGNNRAYPDLGISEGHHALSHHQSDPAKLAQISTIDTWQMGIYAHLLRRLDEINEGEGSLLDHTTVMSISEVEDGNSHRHYNLPVVLAGRVADLNMGRYVDITGQDHPLANLYLTLLQDAGSPIQTFGDDGVNPLSI